MKVNIGQIFIWEIVKEQSTEYQSINKTINVFISNNPMAIHAAYTS